MTPAANAILSAYRRELPTMPSLRDLVPQQSVIPLAYGDMLEASGDLMDHVMKHATEEDAAVIYHLAQAMAERMDVLKQLAETRLQRFVNKEGA
jgi:hypothetical protein